MKKTNNFFDLTFNTSETLAMINEMKKSKIFPELTDEFYKHNVNTLWRIYKDNLACKKSKSNKCANELGWHLWFDVLKNGQMTVIQRRCIKHKDILSKQEFVKNYIWRSFDKSLLDLEISEANIDKKWDKSRQQLIEHMIGTCEKFSSAKNYYLYGPTGVGKTYITALLCNKFAAGVVKRNKVILSPKRIAYIFLPDLISKFVKKFSQNESIDEEFNKICETDVLVIDDLGSETIRDWFVNEYFIKMLNARNEKDKLTIFVSNMSIGQLKSYYINKSRPKLDADTVDRLISRIHGLVGDNIFALKGKDWRIKKTD